MVTNSFFDLSTFFSSVLSRTQMDKKQAKHLNMRQCPHLPMNVSFIKRAPSAKPRAESVSVTQSLHLSCRVSLPKRACVKKSSRFFMRDQARIHFLRGDSFTFSSVLLASRYSFDNEFLMVLTRCQVMQLFKVLLPWVVFMYSFTAKRQNNFSFP